MPATITLIGTGHVFDLRSRLQREVMSRMPDVVCLELDPGRLQALLTKEKGGKVPPMYKLLAEFQERIASDQGVDPGDEMLAAFEAARQAGIAVELIDMDARLAFQRMWKGMGFLEKGRFLGSAVVGMVMPRSYMDKEIDKLREDVDNVMEQVGKEYPTVKRVLIDERNDHMARRLLHLRQAGAQRIVAVVGDGHVSGITTLLGQAGLEGHELEVLRLKELDGPGPEAGLGPGEGGTASAGFTVEMGWEP